MAPRPFIQRLAVDVAGIAIEDNLTSQPSGIGTHINQIVGSAHNLLVVFYHNDGIAQRLQLFQHIDKSFGVAAVEPYAWLIEDIERADERVAKRCTEVDALALTPGECI